MGASGNWRARRSWALPLIALLLLATGGAHAGTIFLSGDVTPAYYLTDVSPDPAVPGNREFFASVLGDGSRVAIRGTPSELHAFYAALPGVSATLVSRGFGSDELADVDLFVVAFPLTPFSSNQIRAMSKLLDEGGSLFFLGDSSFISGGSTANANINEALSGLGVSMHLDDNNFDIGFQIATDEQIAANPLTSRVDEFHYGAASSVTGGVPLFYTQGMKPFVAFVPEPRTLSLLSAGVAAFAMRRKRMG
jgi:hypothetical protein